jgi:DNA modification methylase
MTTQNLQINELIEIPEFRNFYVPQPIDDLVQSVKIDGQQVPIHVTQKLEIINGYRMVDAIRRSGGSTVVAIIKKIQPNLYDRILLNQTRVKTTNDQVGEIKELFKRFPKKQGQKNKDGNAYSRDLLISAALNGRFKADKIIKKLEEVVKQDLYDDILLKGILEKYWKVETCHDFLQKFMSMDLEHNFGFTDKVVKGLISIGEANKFIAEKYWLDNQYQDTFVIPEKVKSYNANCIEIGETDEHQKSVDLLFTSPPYFILRKYENGDPNQVGHEETKEAYCDRIANIIKALVPTLKESANVIINIGETYDNGVGYGIPSLLKSAIERETTLVYKDQLVWSKPNPKPQNETIKRPINNLEYLLWFVVNPEKAKYNLLTYTRERKEVKISKGAKDVDKTGKVWSKNLSLTKPYSKIYSHIKEQDVLNIIEAKIGKNHDVYNIYGEGHPAIMCGVLPVVPILLTTDEGDCVFDPFSGSSVVGRMSLLLNRVSLTAELSNEYFKIGCKMLENSVNDFNRDDLNMINSAAYTDFPPSLN